MTKLYLGIIGKSFAGKETVYKFICDLVTKHDLHYRVSIHHFSDPLNGCLNALKPLDNSRPNQQKLSTLLRQGFSEEILGNAVMYRATMDPSEIVCLDGIRRPADVIKFRALPNFHLIFLDTPIEKRFEFGQKRKDRPVQIWEQFLIEQGAESESKIDEIAQQADIVLNNSGTKKDLKKQVAVKIMPLIVARSPIFLKK